MIWQKGNKSSKMAVRAYANLLQQHLDIIVTPVDFYYAGWYGPVDKTPCSLITVEPFCPGGSRRLVLNARHPLIIAIATTAMSRNAEKHQIAIAMGEAMVWTGSWPLPGLDVSLPSGQIYWKNAKGLICGQYVNMIPPIRHEEVYVDNSDFVSIAIWPKGQYAIVLKTNKSEPSIVDKIHVTFGDKWQRRDELLLDEWKTLMKQNTVPRQSCVYIPNREANGSQKFGMATYSPSLPILALAHFLQKPANEKKSGSTEASNSEFLHTDRATSLGKASAILLSCDRLFCLSLFFNVPLIDRTRTLLSSIRVKHVVRPTPSAEEVTRYRDEAPTDAYESLEKAMLQRADAIWLQANGGRVIVCWSGGIDSTALLVCLLRTQLAIQSDNRINGSQLSVVCDEESIAENPSFYEKHLLSKVPIVHRNGRTVSEIAAKFPGALILTGELGDQIFGSDKCKSAFPTPRPSELSPEEEKILIDSGALESDEGAVKVALNQPWEESLLQLLKARGLLAGEVCDWQQWIAPQVSKAPFPIKSLYDMLWWLNFSCKWQNVTLRCLHDGGEYKPKDGLTGSIVHFYDDRQLECWACVQEFHETKFPDLGNWKTYKEPLKKIIFSYHADEEYYRNKEKVGSLNFELTDTQQKLIDSCAGLVVNSKGMLERFSWGSGSVTDCRLDSIGVGLEYFLDPWILDQVDSTPSFVERVIAVNPWDADVNYTSPFTAAPCFVEEDERKHRNLNPITLITLEAKCSSLLPPDLIRGKTVLDLGACLGAMCHWSLYHGASKAVGVEPQKDFCQRMEKYLASAEAAWPEPQSSLKRYEVICADARAYLSKCEDQSFDVVVAAGVLHCFQDPISILLEIARVSKEAIVIESVHPIFYRKGLSSEPNSFSGSTLELNPSAAVNKAGRNASFAGLSVVPTKDLMKNLFTAVGFSVSSVALAPHPTRNVDVLVYTGSRFYDSTPVRFFLRCQRRSGKSMKLISLEDVIEKGEGNEHLWKDAIANEWTRFRPEQSAVVPDQIKESEKKSSIHLSNVSKVWNKVFRQEESAIVPSQSKECAQQERASNDNSSIHPSKAFKAWYNIESKANGVMFDASSDEYPYSIKAWGHLSEKTTLSFQDSRTTIYGYVFSGETTLIRKRHNSKPLKSSIIEGMFFCCPGKLKIEGGSGFVVSVKMRTAKRNCGIFMVAGPLEADAAGELTGMLPYIDGCSDTVLIHPQVRGEPCLNHLHFPPHINQTQHTHPSGRAGMVIHGEGHCVVVDPVTKEITKTPLKAGMVFVIPTDSPHAFETGTQTLDVVAFHPDSDYGPIATDHPMVNRTIVNGISASLIPSIQTKFS
jgi:hypothetical protein